MTKITFNSYKKAIQNHYDFVKNDDNTSILLTPSPAQLRNYCSMLVDKGLSTKDEEIFRAFFETKSGEYLKKSIDFCNTDKFKTIISFLKDKRDSEIALRIEMASIIVGFSPRPYSNFLNSDSINLNNREKDQIKNIENIRILPTEDNNRKATFGTVALKSKNFKKSIAIGLLGLIGLTSIGYTAKNMIAPEPECMQWQKNHYEVVDCNSENQQSLLKQYDIIPFDEHQSKLFKIEVSDTTTFFKNGKSIYWYCKVDGKPEFFNTHGIHPETGKALKPVSEYIVKKYIR